MSFDINALDIHIGPCRTGWAVIWVQSFRRRPFTPSVAVCLCSMIVDDRKCFNEQLYKTIVRTTIDKCDSFMLIGFLTHLSVDYLLHLSI